TDIASRAHSLTLFPYTTLFRSDSSCQKDFSKDLHLKCTMEAKNYMLYLFSSFFKTLEQITAKTNIQYYKKLVNGKTKKLFSFLPKIKRSSKLTMIFTYTSIHFL